MALLMFSSDIAIKVESLSKCYHIYEKSHDRLIQMLKRGRKQYFREFWALKNVSFEIKKGETVGIIGCNGSGKSTLLQLICGTLNPSSGSVQTFGRIAALLELGSGFNPEFSGRENVLLNGSVLGLSKSEIDKLFDRIVEFSEIGEFINQPVKSYSSGMMVRLAFAVQAMVEPDVLVVDEALAVGDEKFQRKCFSRIEDLKSKGTSILFVSHSGPQIIDLCDRAILLEKGECLLQARPSEAVRVYQRLIYSPPEEHQKLVEQLRDRRPPENLTPHESEEEETQLNSDKIAPEIFSWADKFVDDYDPNLIPSTTTSYPEQGARISDIEIQNSEGKKVNILSTGHTYKFTMSGELVQAFKDVYFGIHIRSITGSVISGQRFPSNGCYIQMPKQNQVFKVTFNFNLALLPSTYFIGGGVWAGDTICAHRIIDMAMIRVVSIEAERSFGYCDLFGGPVEFVLSDL
jgi:lipopolysaccharide transport system ATP-binding protein